MEGCCCWLRPASEAFDIVAMERERSLMKRAVTSELKLTKEDDREV